MRDIKVKLKLKMAAIVGLVSLFSACKSIVLTQVYNGHSSNGNHARGLSVKDSNLLVSGKGGVLSIFDLNQLAVVDTIVLPASDFRGVQVGNQNTVLLMNSGQDGLVYRLAVNNAEADTVLFMKDAFFDAIQLNSYGTGFIFGDPINERLTIFKTNDFGQTWQQIAVNVQPLYKEAAFAASNTNIAIQDQAVYIGTGGADTARLLKSEDMGLTWNVMNTPVKSGDTYGIYSINFWSPKRGIIAGGSYVDKTYNDSIVFYTGNGGKSWQNRSVGLPGYISCVTSGKAGKLIVATGRLGAYYTVNKGKLWELLTEQPFYSVVITNDLICLSGQDGTLAIFQVSPM
jgi:uncharacterized protein YceK